MHLFIDTGNAAFSGENHAPELARIIKELAGALSDYSEEACQTERALRDINGNTVGWVNQGAQPAESRPDRLVLEIRTGNAAFDDSNFGPELSSILSDAALKIEQGFDKFNLRDTNGNIVGEVLDIPVEPIDTDRPVN